MPNLLRLCPGMIGMLDTPTSGKIYIDGKDVATETEKWRRNKA